MSPQVTVVCDSFFRKPISTVSFIVITNYSQIFHKYTMVVTLKIERMREED